MKILQYIIIGAVCVYSIKLFGQPACSETINTTTTDWRVSGTSNTWDTESYLFKHGFFDENILALKLDGSEGYAVFVNENNYDGEINSIDRVVDFLMHKYLDPSVISIVKTATGREKNFSGQKQGTKYIQYKTDKGIIEIEPCTNLKGKNAYLNGETAPDGKYNLGFLMNVEVKNGIVIKE